MQELITITGNTISSKVIAEITGKQHRNVMQDIRTVSYTHLRAHET